MEGPPTQFSPAFMRVLSLVYYVNELVQKKIVPLLCLYLCACSAKSLHAEIGAALQYWAWTLTIKIMLSGD